MTTFCENMFQLFQMFLNRDARINFWCSLEYFWHCWGDFSRWKELLMCKVLILIKPAGWADKSVQWWKTIMWKRIYLETFQDLR